MSIRDGLLIQETIIYAEAECTVFFSDADHWCSIRGLGFDNLAFHEQILYIVFHFFEQWFGDRGVGSLHWNLVFEGD